MKKKCEVRFLEGLNPAQREAVLYNEGPLLIIAGAGSGKTKTLISRVARLVHDGIRPESILLLTFTRRVAQEMMKRASTLLDSRCQNVCGGTFHAFGLLMLRKYARYAECDPSFTILDRSDSEDVIGWIRREHHLHHSEKRFPQKGTLTEIISKAVNTQQPLDHVIEKEYPEFYEFREDIEQVYRDYVIYKKQTRVLDYDDLLTRLLDVLNSHSTVRTALQHTFSHILVDEYQDTNKPQGQIIVHLSGEKRMVTVVGDDSQSIYSFRGANFKNIMDFPKLFSETKIITLEENFRSKQPILDMTNALIASAREKYSKILFTQKKGGNKPVYVETHSENEQSQFICRKILELREEEIPLQKIAVLFRSGWHSNDLEVELALHNIPFVKYGGIKFVEASHVKDVIAFLRIHVNPWDTLSWQRVLLLFEGVGQKTVSSLIPYLQGRSLFSQLDLTSFRSKSFYDEIQRLVTLFTPKENSAESTSEFIEKILAFYKPFFELKYDDHVKRSADLQSIVTISQRYKTIDAFLTEMSLDPPEASQIGVSPESKDEERLTLSTIHSAKGLEWHTVFILSAVDGYLPSFQSLRDPAQLEEERRLLYVAMTRAQEQLFILKPHLEFRRFAYSYGGMLFSKLSRFLEEDMILERFAEKGNLSVEKSPLSASESEAPMKRYCF